MTGNEHARRLGADYMNGAIAAEPVSNNAIGLVDRPLLWKKMSRRIALSPATVILTILILLSLALRLINLRAPFTGEHEFRQTQTAISVWDIREHGLDLLHPRLPLFGPPWECPFEYPVFQIAAAALDSIAT